ncbi:hypothetical protein CspHIS471_0411240 [Cutaneotrichosporon sp. HIS471]|nr:hypothetical protein CspHIS471_0411240 [Cutaneotrichosporon sp. HIS471]
MDHLRPGHGAHRSSSDRLLSNYLESQKLFTTSLLALLSQSHSSTSSLLAYVTSSPGVLLSVRRAVRHSAFEGPLSPSMLENPEAHMLGAEHEPPTPGWAGYIRVLDDFRKDLKQIHLLEEEMTRVKRDKEILVSRLIRQTKTKPTKSDLKEMAKHLNAEQLRDFETMSSRASSLSLSSEVTGVTTGPGGKESRRATKLKDAQVELLGCEEHLRALEVKIEDERNNVMYRGLEERFRAMEVVSQMWLSQARQGLEDLEKLPGRSNGVANTNNFELESNGSLAPSQSASQVGYDESGQSLGTVANLSPRRQMQQRQMQPMIGHGSITSVQEENEGSSDDEPGQGTLVMHENIRRPVSQAQPPAPALPMKDFNPPDRRRATSELGQPSRYIRQQSPPLRHAISSEVMRPPHRAGSDSASERTVTKRRGFFASIARFFKGPKHHEHNSRHGRPPSGSTWGKDSRAAPQYGRRVRSDSSSDDEAGNLVSVSNTLRGTGSTSFAGWNAADVGKVPVKRSQSSASAKRGSGATAPRARPVSAAPHSTPRAAAASKPRPRPASAAGRAQTTAPTVVTITRSNTAKSAPGASKRASTMSARSRSSHPGQSLMSTLDAQPPAMPDVPKAPQSQQGPIPLVRAPGSSLAPSLVLPTQVMHQPRQSLQHRVADDELGPNDSISRVNSTKKKPARDPKPLRRSKSLTDKKDKTEKLGVPEKEPRRSISPLPPSKLRSPPLKSALRPSSPSSYPSQPLGPAPEITTLYDVHAPGPVQLPPDPEPEPAPSVHSGKRRLSAEEVSIYESANEDSATPRASMTLDDSSDDESVDASAFQIINNEHTAPEDKAGPNAPLPALPDDGLQRRKSVRLEVPEENVAEYYKAEAAREEEERRVGHEREMELERARMYIAAANDSDDSLPTQRSSNWDTRIGRVRDDTSEEDDDDPRYVKARRSLMSQTGDFSKKKKKRISIKSTGSPPPRPYAPHPSPRPYAPHPPPHPPPRRHSSRPTTHRKPVPYDDIEILRDSQYSSECSDIGSPSAYEPSAEEVAQFAVLVRASIVSDRRSAQSVESDDAKHTVLDKGKGRAVDEPDHDHDHDHDHEYEHGSRHAGAYAINIDEWRCAPLSPGLEENMRARRDNLAVSSVPFVPSHSGHVAYGSYPINIDQWAAPLSPDLSASRDSLGSPSHQASSSPSPPESFTITSGFGAHCSDTNLSLPGSISRSDSSTGPPRTTPRRAPPPPLKLANSNSSLGRESTPSITSRRNSDDSVGVVVEVHRPKHAGPVWNDKHSDLAWDGTAEKRPEMHNVALTPFAREASYSTTGRKSGLVGILKTKRASKYEPKRVRLASPKASAWESTILAQQAQSPGKFEYNVGRYQEPKVRRSCRSRIQPSWIVGLVLLSIIIVVIVVPFKLKRKQDPPPTLMTPSPVAQENFTGNISECLLPFLVAGYSLGPLYPCGACRTLLVNHTNDFLNDMNTTYTGIGAVRQYCALLDVFFDSSVSSLHQGKWGADMEPCGGWQGIQCDARKRITTLELVYPGVPARLPTSFGDLVSLQTFRVVGDGQRPQAHVRSDSNMSTSSRPRPQQATFVNSGNPLAPRLAGGLAAREAQFDATETETEIEYETTRESRNPVKPDNAGEARAQSWDNVRDGSISRRPAWRRPSPRWVLPFVLGITLSIGMTIPVRAELYLDLACLVHPPSAPASTYPVTNSLLSVSSAAGATPLWPIDISAHAHGNWSVASVPEPVPGSLTPAERWFQWAQRDIFSYLEGREGSIPSEPNSPNPYPEIDPSHCKRDAGVQQTSARLTQIIAVVAGLLSAITTGWWAAYSDRRGRRIVLSVVEVGLLINDLCMVTIASYPRLVVQTRPWILLLGPGLDGLLGGFSTIVAAMHAYISDVTPDGSRATAFSRLGAAIMAGMAVGPVLGSSIIKATGSLLSPFYISVCVHALWVVLIRFLLPESLSSDSRAILKQRAKAAAAAARERDAAERAWEIDGDDQDQPHESESSFARLAGGVRGSRKARRTMGFTRRIGRRAILPLKPLGIFWPQRGEDGRRKYNLLLIAILNFIMANMMGAVVAKANYTFWAFGWSPAQLGPYLSYMSMCRLIVLLVLLPLILRKVKPYFREPAFIDNPSSERTPLLSDAHDTSPDANVQAPPKPKRSVRLDLWIVRLCLFFDMSGYLMMGANTTDSVYLFLAGSTVATLGTPAAPVANSLALSFLPNKHDVGRLFGAMGVLHAIGTNLVAPIVFFSVYSATVATYAPTIFLVAASFMVVGQVTVWIVRTPRREDDERGRGRGVRQTHVGHVGAEA